MPYTTEEGGRLNNFAREPKVYQAEPPSSAQKRNYVIGGVLALILVAGVVAVAVAASAAQSTLLKRAYHSASPAFFLV